MNTIQRPPYFLRDASVLCVLLTFRNNGLWDCNHRNQMNLPEVHRPAKPYCQLKMLCYKTPCYIGCLRLKHKKFDVHQKTNAV